MLLSQSRDLMAKFLVGTGVTMRAAIEAIAPLETFELT